MRPVVRAAIAALDHFGTLDAEHAAALIALWSRYDELTDEDMQEIAAAFTEACIVCGKDRHDGSEDHAPIRTDTLGSG